jgi:hypothetical protein
MHAFLPVQCSEVEQLIMRFALFGFCIGSLILSFLMASAHAVSFIKDLILGVL